MKPYTIKEENTLIPVNWGPTKIAINNGNIFNNKPAPIVSTIKYA